MIFFFALSFKLHYFLISTSAYMPNGIWLLQVFLALSTVFILFLSIKLRLVYLFYQLKLPYELFYSDKSYLMLF